MSEMIERVADALAVRLRYALAYSIPPIVTRLDLETAARAAIEALHEPTLAMLNRGSAAEEANLTYLEHYHEMISAALTETPGSPCPASLPPHAP